jgi:hypothetical protein
LGADNEHRVVDMLIGIDVWKSKPSAQSMWHQMVESFIAYLGSSPLRII